MYLELTTLSIFGYLGFLEAEFSRQWGCRCTHFTAFTKNSKNHRCDACGGRVRHRTPPRS
ncbi:hypothetical protein [Nostoc sp.]|uniref:hypothetical protein n=1 Tax=Nostoc sp. TaxID=1180 RepID=UPI002FF5AD39